MLIDLSDLNAYVNKVSFKMEGITALQLLEEENYNLVSIDLSNASFFAVLFQRENKRYVSIKFDLKSFQLHALPFGSTCSPRI